MSNPHHIALSPSQIKELMIEDREELGELFLDVRRNDPLLKFIEGRRIVRMSVSSIGEYRIIYKSNRRDRMTLATDNDINSGVVRIYRIVSKQTRGRGE